ncbi:MAG TPA: dolichyl-phosphate-mannose-protein mannosyltransferase [Oscillatoriales cyanobacterium M59_W2019_021]|nr:MAG: dolichyl-phosphate-mannose-protein mannosyltransferase [Cyanobacteria bacterium J055]HIK33688.1 dolichyl-phosphate-mannose-protein mannosyltransferase [Oscillatoriales cyanobacterium M4454_W2019_049]HIK52902.1 dolichyl-phosphate-mannose-protein mannosyltransferase [Oscillatoriales cyanobacterium M59_W2019_021]
MNDRSVTPIWLKRTVIVLIVLGIFFRFYNLDRKVYWNDEAMTSLRISGHTSAELMQEVYNRGTIDVAELLANYQYPNSNRSLQDSIDAFAQHPEHSPLYYLMARFWVQFWGSSIAILRSLSAWMSLLVFPCMYWLCRELLPSPTFAWMATGIVAISPFHVLYAQEAREYSLWTVTILLSSAALLKAIRASEKSILSKSSIANWGLYGITVGLGLYAYPFSGLVSISHGLYLALLPTAQKIQKLLAYGFAFLLGLLLFFPWLWIVIQNFNNFINHTISRTNPSENIHLVWGLNLNRIFFDVNQGSSPLNPLLYVTLFLAVYGTWLLCRTTPPKIWLFVLTLMGITGLILIAPDIILGGRRSNNLRYAIPCVLGIQLAVSYLFYLKLKIDQKRLRNRWKYGLLALWFVGIVSCGVSSQVEVWWNKSYPQSRYNPAIARMLNEIDRPLVISDEVPGRILSLSHLLNPETEWQLVAGSHVPSLPRDRAVFLYRPSDGLQQRIQNANLVTIELAYEKGWLWRIRSIS